MKQNHVSAYDLSLGCFQRTEVNGCWIDLYREHGVYHVRMGRIGSGWSRWETFDNTFESPLKCARGRWSDFKKYAKAKNVYPIKCNQCNPMRIQGVFCHEHHTCPNENKVWDWYEGEWIEPEIEEEF